MNQRDFEAILISMQSLDAFAFFNRGYLSGMSLLHKHFQLIPFSAMQVNCTRLPVETALFNSATTFKEVTKFEAFSGIKHCVKVFEDGEMDGLEMPREMRSLSEQARYLLECYQECLNDLDLDESKSADEVSFNFFMTPRLMCIVKRSKGSVKGEGEAIVDINTLGFCGTLAVKNQASLDFVKEQTPIVLLRQVSEAQNNDV